MPNEIIIALIALAGSVLGGGLFGGIVSLITLYKTHKWDNEDKLKTIESKLAKSEADNVRLQMLVLMADYPTEQAELMRVAEHYFKDLGGNWYMTSMFNKWIKDNDISEPEWLRKE